LGQLAPRYPAAQVEAQLEEIQQEVGDYPVQLQEDDNSAVGNDGDNNNNQDDGNDNNNENGDEQGVSIGIAGMSIMSTPMLVPTVCFVSCWKNCCRI
jgi:hypothetical protein